MKTIKPMRAGVLTRPYQWRGQTRLSCGVYVLISSDGKGPYLQSDQKIWAEVLPTLDSGGVLDQIMPKAHPEYLVSGFAYTAHQADKTQCMVRVEVGDLHKELRVCGDRYWMGNSLTQAESFERMPLDWAHAYGGPAFQQNPEGKGIDPVQVNGTSAVPAPNVEDPLQGVNKKSDRPAPASFGPIGPSHPMKMTLQGSYSEEWQKYDFPGFLPDMDPTIFNSAADNQQWRDLEELPLGETFRVWNMHPELECWQSSILSLQARFLLLARDEHHRQYLREVDNMRASTVWLVPELQSYILMFHGSVEILDTEADDVEVIMAGVEYCDSPRSFEHYEKVMMQRLDPEKVMHHLEKDEELVPQALLRADDETDYSVGKDKLGSRLRLYISHQEKQAKSWFENRGLEYTAVIPEFVGPPESPDVFFNNPDRQTKLAQDAQTQALALMRESSDPQMERLADMLDSAHAATDALPIDISGPPDMGMMESAKALASSGTQESARNQTDEMFDTLTSSVRKSYLYSVQYQAAAPALDTAASSPLREEVMRRYRLDGNLSEMDLTGADLSGLVLDGADFSGAFLESVNFEGGRLSDVNFSEAVLARARFSNCVLKSLDFTTANLSEALFSHATVHLCTFRETQFLKMKVRASKFVGCSFANHISDEIEFDNTTLVDCHFDSCIWSEMKMRNTVFESCAFNKWAVVESNLDASRFDETRLVDVSFMTSELKDCIFTKSDLNNLLIEEDVNMAGAKFIGSRLKECNFIGTKITGAQFNYSDISESDFSHAILRDCCFDHVIAREAIFHKSDLKGSSFRNANLIQASLEKANLIGCCFDGAAMFRTNVSKVDVDHTTSTSGAYKDQLELYPVFRDTEASVFRVFDNG
ncbi:DUF2169 domain-containing protein [Advenella kashmirensis]